MHGGIVFSGVFFGFFFVVYSGKSVWAFFYKSCVAYLSEKKIIHWKHHIITDKNNEKDASIFMEVFIVFLFFFLLMIRLFECRFMIY